MFSARTPPRIHNICAQCLRHSKRRLYSSTSNNPPPPPPTGTAKLTNRRLVSLHGQDAPKFLQGLVTANVRPDSRSGFYAAFLTGQGRVLNDVFIYPTLGSRWHQDVNKNEEQGYLVEVDGEQTEALMKHLKRHKLRSKLKLRLLEDGELDVWGLWREDERWTAHTKGQKEGGLIGLTDCRAPGMGQRVLLPESRSLAVLGAEAEGVEEAPLDAYRVRRYLKGVVEGQNEIQREEALPMNANIDIMGGIDFKKGCYIGQELTIRTHHTGVVRRRVLPIALYDHGREPPGTLTYDAGSGRPLPEHDVDIRRDDKRKRATGKFIAGIGNVGLAMCRLEQMSDLTVSGEGSSFSPGDRFVVQSPDGRDIGVKAFVPDWIRGNVREAKVQKRVT
ncbi:ccr4 associated factor [Saxophila tyrrhenica]|uniref:Iron-sulfur cluster assembly factor IBA57 homolog, mitochondrial n=1 Tax=Saxophila tyrrhenica TaxID=1690608 RepID=A0AAV9P8K4_9PEZI|nr:ccr4 associated factor [Saxophila tyrrhenica]